MSAIEIKRIWTAIEDIRGKVSTGSGAGNERMSEMEKQIADLREELRALVASVESASKKLEDQLTSSIKAHVDATLDVVKNDMKAYVKSQIPVGPVSSPKKE
jgi:Spy/CpxP family protein refolding chaperone